MADIKRRMVKADLVTSKWIDEAIGIYERFYGEKMVSIERHIYESNYDWVAADLFCVLEDRDVMLSKFLVKRNGIIGGQYYLWGTPSTVGVNFTFRQQNFEDEHYDWIHTRIPQHLASHYLAHITFLNIHCWQELPKMYCWFVFKPKSNLVVIDVGSYNTIPVMDFRVQYPISGKPYFLVEVIRPDKFPNLKFKDADEFLAFMMNFQTYFKTALL